MYLSCVLFLIILVLLKMSVETIDDKTVELQQPLPSRTIALVWLGNIILQFGLLGLLLAYANLIWVCIVYVAYVSTLLSLQYYFKNSRPKDYNSLRSFTISCMFFSPYIFATGIGQALQQDFDPPISILLYVGSIPSLILAIAGLAFFKQSLPTLSLNLFYSVFGLIMVALRVGEWTGSYWDMTRYFLSAWSAAWIIGFTILRTKKLLEKSFTSVGLAFYSLTYAYFITQALPLYNYWPNGPDPKHIWLWIIYLLITVPFLGIVAFLANSALTLLWSVLSVYHFAIYISLLISYNVNVEVETRLVILFSVLTLLAIPVLVGSLYAYKRESDIRQALLHAFHLEEYGSAESANEEEADERAATNVRCITFFGYLGVLMSNGSIWGLMVAFSTIQWYIGFIITWIYAVALYYFIKLLKARNGPLIQLDLLIAFHWALLSVTIYLSMIYFSFKIVPESYQPGYNASEILCIFIAAIPAIIITFVFYFKFEKHPLLLHFNINGYLFSIYVFILDLGGSWGYAYFDLFKAVSYYLFAFGALDCLAMFFIRVKHPAIVNKQHLLWGVSIASIESWVFIHFALELEFDFDFGYWVLYLIITVIFCIFGIIANVFMPVFLFAISVFLFCMMIGYHTNSDIALYFIIIVSGIIVAVGGYQMFRYFDKIRSKLIEILRLTQVLHDEEESRVNPDVELSVAAERQPLTPQKGTKIAYATEITRA